MRYQNVFLADDDPDDQEIFQDAIRTVDSSIICLVAADGERALQALSGDIFEKPDIIFLDLNMPLLNGKQVLAALKANETLKQIPVVMYSTHMSERDIIDIQKLGAVHYLLKPTGFSALVESLRGILNKHWS